MPHTHLLHTQLIETIKAKDIEKVHDCISQGVNVNYVNNTCTSSAIEEATRVGSIEIVDLLINYKADPNTAVLRFMRYSNNNL